MKKLLIILMLMNTINAQSQSGKAITNKKTFSRTTTVSIEIKADAAIVWALLINAADYSRWNSTIISIEGNIALNEKIALKSTLDEKRTFKLKVKQFQPEAKLVWGDSKGNREMLLVEKNSEYVTFTMTETISGLMFPMYAKYIPPFNESFELFAHDLKKEAELISNTK